MRVTLQSEFESPERRKQSLASLACKTGDAPCITML